MRLARLVLASLFLSVAVPAGAQDAGEIAFWDSVKDSKNAAELKAYLDAYPQGKFAPLARIRLKALGGDAAAPAPAAAATSSNPFAPPAQPAPSAQATPKPDEAYARLRADCEQEEPDRQIAGCTAVIDNPHEPVAVRAVATSNRGWGRQKKGDIDGALADYDAALRLDPNNVRAHYNRADAWLAKGDADRAISDYDALIRIDAKDADAYAGRGLAYARKGDQSRALADFDAALRIDPKQPEALKGREEARASANPFAPRVAEAVHASTAKSLPETTDLETHSRFISRVTGSSAKTKRESDGGFRTDYGGSAVMLFKEGPLGGATPEEMAEGALKGGHSACKSEIKDGTIKREEINGITLQRMFVSCTTDKAPIYMDIIIAQDRDRFQNYVSAGQRSHKAKVARISSAIYDGLVATYR